MIENIGLKLMCIRAKYRREGNFEKSDEIRKDALPFYTFQDHDWYCVTNTKWEIPKEIAEIWDTLSPLERIKYRKDEIIKVKRVIAEKYDYEYHPQNGKVDEKAFEVGIFKKYEKEIADWFAA